FNAAVEAECQTLGMAYHAGELNTLRQTCSACSAGQMVVPICKESVPQNEYIYLWGLGDTLSSLCVSRAWGSVILPGLIGDRGRRGRRGRRYVSN
ncbi:hypothetical protein KIPB_015528, partial [Kipferlia bialata]